MLLWFFIGYLVATFICIIFQLVYFLRNKYGDFVMDTSDPNKDVFRIEYTKHPGTMRYKKNIIFRIRKVKKL